MKQMNLFERAYGGNEGIVYQTRNYEMFLYIGGNRKLTESNVAKLADDIKRKGQIEPVQITEKNYVVDGQHRIAACKKLRLPVNFVIKNLNGLHPLEAVESVNTIRKNWDWKQRLNMYCEMGNINYLNYRKLISRFQFDHTAMLSIVLFRYGTGGNSGGGNEFNKGYLKIKSGDLENIIERSENIELYWNLISRAFANMPGKNRKRPPAKLIKAFVKVMKHENYDHDIMRGKLKNDVTGFVGINTIDGFVGELVKIYNLRNRDNNIKFN